VSFVSFLWDPSGCGLLVFFLLCFLCFFLFFFVFFFLLFVLFFFFFFFFFFLFFFFFWSFPSFFFSCLLLFYFSPSFFVQSIILPFLISSRPKYSPDSAFCSNRDGSPAFPPKYGCAPGILCRCCRPFVPALKPIAISLFLFLF